MTVMPRPGWFEIRETDAGWHLNAVGGNGEIVLTSEVYTRPQQAHDAIVFLRNLFAAGDPMIKTSTKRSEPRRD